MLLPKRVQRKKIVGHTKQYPTRSDAKKAVENLRAEINAPMDTVAGMTVRELWATFKSMNFVIQKLIDPL